MDLGVGSFVFSQGIVSSIPLLKDPAHLTAPLRSKLVSVTKKTLPIIFLGLIRVLLVKGTEYPVRCRDSLWYRNSPSVLDQEHESEYGTHWNFFITLALLPILQVILHPLIRRVPISLVGVLVAICKLRPLALLQTIKPFFPGHQLSLSLIDMQSFVLYTPRTSIISANKEGIVSLSGEALTPVPPIPSPS